MTSFFVLIRVVVVALARRRETPPLAGDFGLKILESESIDPTRVVVALDSSGVRDRLTRLSYTGAA